VTTTTTTDEAPRAPGYFARVARQGGFDPDRIRPMIWIARILLALVFALLALEWLRGAAGPLWLALAAAIGFVLPDLWLLRRRRERQRRIESALSFFLDVLVSLLQAGLDLPEAFRRAGAHGLPGGHPLADEVQLVTDEIAAGKDRATAFGALAARTNVRDLHAVAAALELGSRLGFPVAGILATQAEIQRERRADRARRRIDRAMMVALVPVILCGLPLFFVVVVAPIVLELLRTVQLLRQ
jgi:tight adherence protein C